MVLKELQGNRRAPRAMFLPRKDTVEIIKHFWQGSVVRLQHGGGGKLGN